MQLSLRWAASRPEDRVPRHEITVSEIVALEFHRRSMLMIQKDPGDEVVSPT
ncbi:hypothetical protein PSE10C_13470 [Pseudomonas amygdali pv. eriobotryae]|nr:hypothetical protein PSE10C_13470 [Pseudomonas amygdali pv. eriobotryae]